MAWHKESSRSSEEVRGVRASYKSCRICTNQVLNKVRLSVGEVAHQLRGWPHHGEAAVREQRLRVAVFPSRRSRSQRTKTACRCLSITEKPQSENKDCEETNGSGLHEQARAPSESDIGIQFWSFQSQQSSSSWRQQTEKLPLIHG